jgi:hypothetical protein
VLLGLFRRIEDGNHTGISGVAAMTEEILFHEALAKAPAERAAFLEAACAGQPEPRVAVSWP